jgi:glycosyltransferase involved in cell wall biosynthesis
MLLLLTQISSGPPLTMNSSFLTIGIPTFNRAPQLYRALASLAALHTAPDEIIVSDNCSVDNTPEVVGHWAARLSNLRYIRREHNAGPLANMLSLVERANGKYFLWLADDDVLAPRCISTIKDALQAFPDAAMVGWAHSTHNYALGTTSVSSSFPDVRATFSHATNARNYLLNPISSYFYSMFERRYLLSSKLRRWYRSGAGFDWLDCALVLDTLLNEKAQFMKDQLAIYGVDSVVRPKKALNGSVMPTSYCYNGTRWLKESTRSILGSRAVPWREKPSLLRLFWRTWHNVTSHVRRHNS